MISRFVLALAVLVAFVSTAGAASIAVAAETFDRMVIFGDSLSDPGNHFVAFGITSEPPYTPLPDFPYAMRGHHFSNGPTWVEHLAHSLGMPASGKPALRAPRTFTNYAVGRARARGGAPEFSEFDLGTQVQRFLADFGGQAPSNAVYVVWIGANDFDDALVAAQKGDSDTATAIVDAALTAIAGNVSALWFAGARAFVIPNLPDPALSPLVHALGPEAQAAATAAEELYNVFLDALVMYLRGLPGIEIVQFDARAALAEIVAAHGDGELRNVTEPCLEFGVTAHPVCKHPNDYLFWDAAHPTTEGHRRIAKAALRLFEATWLSVAADARDGRR